MVNNIRSSFTINDFENISGIKAHTIRMWEKRYQLFEPERARRNIRYYNLDSLKKLLNIVLLYNNGVKISKIAKLNEDEVSVKTKEIIHKSFKDHKSLNSFKISMYSFNSELFNEAYEELIRTKTFREIFKSVFIPFLDFIGLMWQTKSITVAHEHFVSNLIFQKIQLNIENLSWNNSHVSKDVYVLYLPQEEMHEIGLMYLNYELLLRGEKTIYLGRAMPISDLLSITEQFENIKWVSYFVVAPSGDGIEDYLKEVEEKILFENNEYYVVCNKENVQTPSDSMVVCGSLSEMLKII